ncbi:MAG: DUF2974 domain-containing protein [Firmicutes bacterium]|nr:DUF2974 domain-containing protein [Bacillota bacterium]
MSNIFDYLAWRADVPFSVDPFNEVDNLVLSELAYTDFEGIVDEAPVSLEDACAAYFARYSREEVLLRTTYTGKAPLLMEEMVKGARFRGTILSNSFSELDKDQNVQIAAVTFHLPDGTTYIAFRGTDGTLIGWKEDFGMGFESHTAGQQRAARYLNEVGRITPGTLRVGGHSKGGNFAVYASAFCDSEIRERIREVYTNDGPGFRDDILATPEYDAIVPRVISIVPDTSIIGMLLGSEGVHRIIDSTAVGLVQHDAFTWQVLRNRFVQAEATELGIFIDQSIKHWFAGMDDEERRTLTDTIFTAFETAGMENFHDGTRLKRLEMMYQSLRKLPKEQQSDILRAVGLLFQSGGQTAWAKLLGEK